jgi:hypothetical protein
LVYDRARYYDPSTQQLLTFDPLVGPTGEPYAYADDSPINGSDPLGLWGPWDAVSCIGSQSGGLGPLQHLGACVQEVWSAVEPDYVAMQGSSNRVPVVIPGTSVGCYLGIQGGVSISKTGGVFLDIGPPCGGAGESAYVGVGYIGGQARATASQAKSYLSGWSLSGGGTFQLPTEFDPGIVGVWGNAPQLSASPPSLCGLHLGSSDVGMEAIAGSRQWGVSYTWAHKVGQLRGLFP